MSDTHLRRVKLLHTVVWVFFVACIIGIPLAASLGEFRAAFWLIGVVAIEVLVLALNGWRCPLTGVAARFTEERQDNFDIYLPLWLARYNKQIFGPLYVASTIYAVARWYVGR